MPHMIVRTFRGATLYLASESQASNLFDWSNDPTRATLFDSQKMALRISERAAAEYGAVCVVTDAAGNAVATRKARSAEPTGKAAATEFPALAKARTSQHSAHCDEHTAYTDGCYGCHVAHVAHVDTIRAGTH